MDRSVEMIAALLGILKSGAAYVPLNFEHPAARLSVQLREAGAALVVTQEKLVDQLDGVEGDLVLVERARSELQTESDENPARTNEPGDDVYVMYTSGSTGVPKGIAVTHTNLVNYVAYMVQRLDARDALQFATVTAISTDLGNTSVFPSLASGGCLHLIDPESAMDSSRFAEYVRLNAVDVLKITPSHLAALVTGGDGAAVLPRRWLVIGGEAASWELTTRIRELGDCKILNHYGPTETTVGSCTFDLETDVSAWRPATLPIGRPIANSFAYILDRILEPVPVGVEGELCIGGAGVARGYVGRPDLTAELFVPDPFADGERMYRTGDRARYLPDGNIEFLGRKDQQVKIRGFRIELGEIEQALGAHPKIRQAAVVAQQHAAGDPRLVGYLVTEDEPDVEELQGFLGRTLPDYMIPATFVRIDAMPFTPSGKVDRRALPDPSRYEVETRARYVAPRTPLEEGLADIWAEVLGVERVGVDDDFFALGGHSLLATQVIARVRSTYSVDIPLHSLFLAPTVGGLAEAVVKLQGNGGPDEAELAQILSELEGLSEEDAQQLLTTDRDQRDDG